MTSRRYVKAFQDARIKQEHTGYNNPDAEQYIKHWFRTLKEETVCLQKYSVQRTLTATSSSPIQSGRILHWNICLQKNFANFSLQMQFKCLDFWGFRLARSMLNWSETLW
jgi:hypothetical protein